MKKLSLIVLGAFALTLVINEAQAGPCERRCNTSSVTDDELTECLKKCKGEPVEPSGGGGGGGGHVDWCKKFEDCKTELLEMIPDCEAEDIIPPFDGPCKEQFKSCEAAKKVAPQINELCKNKKGCELAPCMYTGTEVPAESCPPGCPEWYNEIDGKCVPVTCEPICADEVLAVFAAHLPPWWLLWLLVGMGGLGLIFLVVLLSRKPKKEPEPPFVECPKCEKKAMQNGVCRECWYHMPAPQPAAPPAKTAEPPKK